MKTNENINWVSIGEACRTLGVTEVTLRQWSDAGYVRTFVTPGGHRRYNIEELNAFINSHGNSININDLSESIINDTDTHKAVGMSGMHLYENKTPFNKDTLNALKTIGADTLNMITNYLKNTDCFDKAESDAINVGYQYGFLLKKAGLSVSEAVNSFLSHQDLVISKTVEILNPQKSVSNELIDIIPNVNKLLSTALSAMVEYYTNN